MLPLDKQFDCKLNRLCAVFNFFPFQPSKDITLNNKDVMDAFHGKQFGRRRKKQQASVNQEGPAGED
jgi:hypothetical protein